MDAVIEITDGLAIPASELDFRVSRSSGPGGQGVNTTDSRVELRFDVAASPSLSEEQRERLLQRLASRIDTAGTLRIVAQTHRSQLQNRREAVSRFQTLLAEALRPSSPRVPTRPSAASRRRREAAKRHRADVKRVRRPPAGEE